MADFPQWAWIVIAACVGAVVIGFLHSLASLLRDEREIADLAARAKRLQREYEKRLCGEQDDEAPEALQFVEPEPAAAADEREHARAA